MTDKKDKVYLWCDRRAAFEALSHLQSEDAEKTLYLAEYDGRYHGHHMLSAVPVQAGGGCGAFVLVHTLHQDDVPAQYTIADLVKKVGGVSINSPAQARAVVKALAGAFGSAIMEKS